MESTESGPGKIKRGKDKESEDKVNALIKDKEDIIAEIERLEGGLNKK